MVPFAGRVAATAGVSVSGGSSRDVPADCDGVGDERGAAIHSAGVSVCDCAGRSGGLGDGAEVAGMGDGCGRADELSPAASSSLHAFPYYLAYANEAFGGPAQSYRWMAGTNGDGGQKHLLPAVAATCKRHQRQQEPSTRSSSSSASSLETPATTLPSPASPRHNPTRFPRNLQNVYCPSVQIRLRQQVMLFAESPPPPTGSESKR